MPAQAVILLDAPSVIPDMKRSQWFAGALSIGQRSVQFLPGRGEYVLHAYLSMHVCVMQGRNGVVIH